MACGKAVGPYRGSEPKFCIGCFYVPMPQPVPKCVKCDRLNPTSGTYGYCIQCEPVGVVIAQPDNRPLTQRIEAYANQEERAEVHTPITAICLDRGTLGKLADADVFTLEALTDHSETSLRKEVKLTHAQIREVNEGLSFRRLSLRKEGEYKDNTNE